MKTKRGIGAVIMTLIVIALIIGVNFAATALQNAVPALSADLTSNGLFRLSDETKHFLNTVDDDIRITVLIDEEQFIANGTYFNQANSIARQFAAYSPRVTLRYRDYLDNTAALENQYPDITMSESSVFIIESSKRYCVLDATDIFNVTYDSTTYSAYISSSKVEQALATGILASTSDKLSKIAFISGVGDDSAYASLSGLLEENAFNVVNVSLVTSSIPEDADIAILFAPNADLDSITMPKLRAFLENEGKTLIYISGYQNIETPNLDALLAEYRLGLGDGLMYETSDDMIIYAADPPISIVNYGNEVYYDTLENADVPFASPNTRAVEVTGDAKVMLYSSTQAVVLPFENLDSPEGFDFDGAMTGAPVAAAAVGSNGTSSVVLFGSSDAFEISVLGSTAFNNSAYIVNVCNTAAGRGEDFNIVIESKSMNSSNLDIKYKATVTALTVIFRWIVPILFIVAAAAVLIIRRRK